MRQWLYTLLFGMGSLLLLVVGCSEPPPQPLTIAASANVHYALDSLVSVFEEQYGVSCEIVVSSSGKLTAQIAKGAPYDIFLSADMRYPYSLYEEGYVKHEPVVYGLGSLVLWSFHTTDAEDLWQVLTAEATRSIAIANPKTAPYGRATLQTLEALGLEEQVGEKLIYGESISQVNHFITSGAAEIGFTAKSVVLAPGVDPKGYWLEVSPEHYTPIAQGMVIVDHDGYEVPAALDFYRFMLSPTAQSILRYYGYQIPE